MALETGRIEWNGDAVTARTARAAARGLGHAAEHLLGVSRQLVPLEEGTLERSGVASVSSSGAASADAATLQAAVSYDTPYAVIQHEDMTFRHDPGRQAKYLEQPMATERDVMLELIAAEIRRDLEGT